MNDNLEPTTARTTSLGVGCSALLDRLAKQMSDKADAAYRKYDMTSHGEQREYQLGKTRAFEAAELMLRSEMESLSNDQMMDPQTPNQP